MSLRAWGSISVLICEDRVFRQLANGERVTAYLLYNGSAS
jgi:hypothetical protein